MYDYNNPCDRDFGRSGYYHDNHNSTTLKGMREPEQYDVTGRFIVKKVIPAIFRSIEGEPTRDGKIKLYALWVRYHNRSLDHIIREVFED